MARRRTLRLKTREQRELEYYRDHDGRPYVRERCSAVLKVAAGEAPHNVARSPAPNTTTTETRLTRA